MPHYLVRLQLLSPLGTPLHSGTLFGHLCWAWRETGGSDGEKSLTDWLESLSSRPFLISDGLPAGWLPRPLLDPWPRKPPPEDPRQRREYMETAKQRRKARLMRREDFLRLRTRFSPEDLDQVPSEHHPKLGLRGLLKRESLPHNRIDRRTGHTLEEGGLFFLEEFWPHPECNGWDVYVETDLPVEKLRELFEHVGACGYGRDATWGRGRFRASVSPLDSDLFDFPGPRRMSLSHGSLTENMRDPRYRLDTHYGKLGNFLARSANPFKYPLVLLAPGATFEPEGRGPFGALLKGHEVQPLPPESIALVHNAWHLTVPYNELPPPAQS